MRREGGWLRREGGLEGRRVACGRGKDEESVEVKVEVQVQSRAVS